MVIPYSRGAAGNQKLFKIQSYLAKFLRFGVIVVQYDQISQIGGGLCTGFEPIRPDDHVIFS